MTRQVVEGGEAEGAGVATILELQDVALVSVRPRELGHVLHVVVGEDVCAGVRGHVDIARCTHHHGAATSTLLENKYCLVNIVNQTGVK